jgi:hypothetical protein
VPLAVSFGHGKVGLGALEWLLIDPCGAETLYATGEEIDIVQELKAAVLAVAM